MSDNTLYFLLTENKIIDIVTGDPVNTFSKEIDLQKHLSEYFQNDYEANLILLEEWSFERMPGSDVRRKHDLVFLCLEEFPPSFWIIEVKKKFAREDHPFKYFYEAKERARLWKSFGVNNIVPHSLLPAPKSLQKSPLLASYASIMSFLKNQEDKRVYENSEVIGSDETELWGYLDDDDLSELKLEELREELRKRNLSYIGRRKTLINRILEFQEELESKEGTYLTFIDVNLYSIQDWCVSNGITTIRLTQTKNGIGIIIVPPNISPVILSLYNLSKGAGGENYDFWDLETNEIINEIPKNPEQLDKILEERKEEDKWGSITGNFGLKIHEDKFNEIEYYHWILDTITDTLMSYIATWKELRKIHVH